MVCNIDIGQQLFTTVASSLLCRAIHVTLSSFRLSGEKPCTETYLGYMQATEMQLLNFFKHV